MYYALKNLKTYIGAHLETYLLQIDAEENITLPRWKTLETYEVKNFQFPVIELLAVETATDYLGELALEHWEIHSIDADFGFVGDDNATLQRDQTLYREAMRRLVAADITAGGLFNRFRLGRTSYSPLLKSQKEKKLLKILRQNLQVRVLSN